MPERLALKTSMLLSQAFALTLNEQPGSPGLRFPSLRTGAMRVSEQEARVAMCHSLEADGRAYAVEYPTRQAYSFSGKNVLSARTDLVVLDGLKPTVAVEFKSGQPKQADVDKDMEKLAVERVRALWFHTIASTTQRTLPTLIRKLDVGIRHGAATLQASPSDQGTEPHELTVAIAVLQGQHVGLWMRTLPFGQALPSDLAGWQFIKV